MAHNLGICFRCGRVFTTEGQRRAIDTIQDGKRWACKHVGPCNRRKPHGDCDKVFTEGSKVEVQDAEKANG